MLISIEPNPVKVGGHTTFIAKIRAFCGGGVRWAAVNFKYSDEGDYAGVWMDEVEPGVFTGTIPSEMDGFPREGEVLYRVVAMDECYKDAHVDGLINVVK